MSTPALPRTGPGRRALLLGLPALSLAPRVASAAPEAAFPELLLDEDFTTFSASESALGRWRTVLGYGGARALTNRALIRSGDQQAFVSEGSLGAFGNTPIGISPFLHQPGRLTIEARPTPDPLRARLWNQPFISGLISTQFSLNLRYGRFDIQARMPAQSGVRAAMWLLRRDRRWPPDIEIASVTGNEGARLSTGFTTRDGRDGAIRTVRQVAAHLEPGADFRTYSLSWGPTRVAWLLDGRVLHEAATPADLHAPMHLLIGLRVGDHWSGEPGPGSAFPARLDIARVRIWAAADAEMATSPFTEDAIASLEPSRRSDR